MARAKQATEGTRLTHTNGATVVVSSDKAERLLAGSLFTAGKTKRPTAASPDQDS